MKQIAKIKLLSIQEESELCARIKKGDHAALNKLVESNLRFVVKVAQNYMNQGLSFEDLICVGNQGLITAAKKFESNKNFKFVTYAVWWIRQAILNELADSSRIVRVPVNKVQRVHNFAKNYENLKIKYNGEISIEDLVVELKMPKDDVILYMGLMHRAVELDKNLEDSEKTLLDQFVDTEADPDFLEEEAKKAAVAKAFTLVNESEKAILVEYYGLDSGFPKTLDDIASTRNMSRERVRQIKQAALTRINRILLRDGKNIEDLLC